MLPLVQDHLGLLQIDLPSPNVVGVYDEANALGDPYVAMAYDTLIDPAVRLPLPADHSRWRDVLWRRLWMDRDVPNDQPWQERRYLG